MATPSSDHDANDTPQPTTTNTVPNTPVNDTVMEGIETSDAFAYETTLQFYDPHAVQDSTSDRTTVGKQVKEWLSAFLLRNQNTKIRLQNGNELKLTEFPPTEAAVQETLQYEIFNNNRRNVSFLFTIESAQRFSDIKATVIDHLQRKNMYMSRHLFKTKKTNIAKCGFFIGKHPRDTFRDVFVDYIESNMSKILSDMTEAEQLTYAKEFYHDINDAPREGNEVRIQECEPTWTVANNQFTTSALAVFCPRADMYLIMDLLTKIFPGVPADEFDDDPVIKFIPFSTPYNHAIPNPEQAYISLIHEQNEFLKEHVGIPVGGLSYEAMQYSPADGSMALDSTLHCTKLFTALEPTSIVNKTGKWIFCTTRKKASDALEYIEKTMPLVYAQVPAEIRGDYPMCPNPRRLTRSPIRKAYMVNIVNRQAKPVPTSTSNLTTARVNAWRSGPPSNLRPADPDTASTGSASRSLGSTHVITAIDEHREEVNVSITQIQSSMQKLQAKTETQLSTLSSQLQSQIQQIQLDSATTRDAIQSSPALTVENLTQLKSDIVKELTPIIQESINCSVPQIIRKHLDDTLGPAIYQVLLKLQQSGVTMNGLTTAQLPAPTQLHFTATGGSPPRKQPKHHEQDPMESVLSPAAPVTQPPESNTPPNATCS
jgi:hypothetical protein